MALGHCGRDESELALILLYLHQILKWRFVSALDERPNLLALLTDFESFSDNTPDDINKSL